MQPTFSEPPEHRETKDLDAPAFTNRAETVISYKGDNYYKACGVIVGHYEGGLTSCVKRLNHPGNVHEDWAGRIVGTKPEQIFPEWTTATPIDEAVGQAIGAASMCWEHVEDAGVFDSTRAKQIVDELVQYFESKQPIY